MAIIETSRPVPFGAVATLNVVNLFDTLIEAVRTSRQASKTNKVLNRLTMGQLEDIGLVASNVNSYGYTVATRRVL